MKKSISTALAALTNAGGVEVRLSELLRKGPVVLTWYRGGWCPCDELPLAATYVIAPDGIVKWAFPGSAGRMEIETLGRVSAEGRAGLVGCRRRKWSLGDWQRRRGGPRGRTLREAMSSQRKRCRPGPVSREVTLAMIGAERVPVSGRNMLASAPFPA